MTQQDQLNAITAWQTAEVNANQMRAAHDATVQALAVEQGTFRAVQAQAAASVAAEQKKVDAANVTEKAAKATLDAANAGVAQAYTYMVQALQAPLDPPSSGAELLA